MTKKQVHKTAAEVKSELGEEAEQAIDKQCAEEVEATLKKHKRALFPFIQRMDAASVARVRLVRTEEQEKVVE